MHDKDYDDDDDTLIWNLVRRYGHRW